MIDMLKSELKKLGYDIVINEEEQEFHIIDPEGEQVSKTADYIESVFEPTLRSFLLNLKNHAGD